MADKKVSELDAIAGSATAADDLFLIVDASGSVTKKITRAELNNAIEQDVLSTVDINGGTIDSTVIGGATPAAGDFTTLGATGNITVGGTVDGRDVAADGTKLDGIASSATANPNAIDNVVEDSSPQLGGALDVNGNSITSASNGDVTIDPNGTGDIVLDAKVGISTTSPESALQVTGAVNTTPDSSGVHLGMDSNYATIELAGSDGGQLDFPNAANTDYRGRIRYTASDNKMAFFASGAGTQTMTVTNTSVGIGTSSPTLDGSLAGLSVNGSGTVLHVNDGDGATLKLTDPATGANRGLGITLQGTSAAISNCESGELRFGTGNTERMRLDSSGNLLVGNSTFGAEDGVYISQGGNYVWARSDDTSGYFDRTGSDGKILELRKDGTTVGSIKAGNGDLLIGTGSVNLRFFDATPAVIPRTASDGTSTGAVDLGNISNKFKDGYFSNGILARYHYNIDDPDTYIDFATSNLIKFFTGGSERGRFDSSGNFLIGTTNAAPRNFSSSTYGIRFIGDQPEFGIDTAYFNKSNGAGTLINFRQSGTDKGTIAVSSSGTTYNTTSDRRLKSNIQDAASASDKIDAIQVRQFDWNVDDSHQDYGLIAQELQPIEPLAVTGDADSDEMMAVDYSKLIPMLIKEIQELRGRVASLEAS